MKPHAAALAALFALLACARGLPPHDTRPPAGAAGDQAAAPTDPAVPPPAAAADPGSAATSGDGSLAGVAAAEPSPPPRAPHIPQQVRVGLATDLLEVRLPCCAVPLVLRAAGRRLAPRTAVRIEPVVRVAKEPVFRLQAAALRAEAQARALASGLERTIGGPSEVVFDADDGLYRVRLGRYPTRAAAEVDAEQLRRRGVVDTWVVSEQPRLVDPALAVSLADGRRWVVPGRWLEIAPAAAGGPDGIALHGQRYRGELLVYVNDRGSLNLINRLTLDDYLRGVVPREMGPEAYGDLEALKAQAVAARTYTLRNLGEFRAEGYDICATPRCQVYGGIGSEHALSDRAVSETSGEVLMARGEIADAMYSSTCGGHTENVEVVFPGKRHSYLRGVPCVEGGEARLAGEAGSPLIEAAVLERLLPGIAPGELAGFATGARRLAERAGLAATAPPRSSDRREIHAFLGRLLSFEPLAATAVPARWPAGWGQADLLLAARLRDAGLMENRRSEAIEAAELRRVLFRLAIYLRLLERADGRFLSLDDDALRLKRGSSERRWAVAADVATFGRHDGALRPAPVTLVAGDAVTAYAAGDRLLALVQRHEPHGSGSARPSRYSSWRHFRSDRQLERLVNSRYPGLGFRHLEIIERGVSGRVATLRLTGRDGERVEVEGLPIRWLLDLPDTLFTAQRTTSSDGEKGWLFTGSGWGHGVGMCQVGAFGMARRGHRYDDILDHYYTGLELRKLSAPAS